MLWGRGLDLVDELLQANRTAVSLQEHRNKAKNTNSWNLDSSGLLTYEERLVVAKENSLRT